MRQSITFLALLASTVVAEDVISFFFPGGMDGVVPVATIETANPSTTEMTIACPTDVDSTYCGLDMGVNIKIISGTSYEVTASYDSTTAGLNCEHNTQAAEMTCTASAMDEAPQTVVMSGSEITFVSATIVEGAELLSATGSASASASARSAKVAANSVSATGSGLTTSASTMATGSASASSQASGSSQASHSGATSTSSGTAVPVSTGAAARLGMEGSAILALAGVAALNLW